LETVVFFLEVFL